MRWLMRVRNPPKYRSLEVLGRYSNLRDQGERIRDILEMVPAGPKRAKVRTPRQPQHRLSPVEIDDLVGQYRAGAKIDNLATQFDINRDTVFSILNRQRVARRQLGVPPKRVEKVINAYKAGSSLAVIGAELAVDPGTVARTLRHAGVAIRPRPGWRYEA